MKAALFAALFLFTPNAVLIAQNNHILKNSHLEVVVDLETGEIGQIHDLLAPDSTLVFNSNDAVFKITSGDFQPASFSILSGDSISLILESNTLLGDSSQIDFRTAIEYELIDRRLAVSYEFESMERVELAQGIDINLSSSVWDTIAIQNHFLGEVPMVLGHTTKTRYLGLNQLYQLHNGIRTLNMVIPNPYHSIVTITPMGQKTFQLRWHVLVACEPFNALEPAGPRLASVLPQGTKIYRRFELILAHDDDPSTIGPKPIAYLSPFPNRWEQVIAMTFDDIPFGSWLIPKSGHDPDAPRQQYLIRLLEDHPRMKMGWIILPDAIFGETAIINPGYPSGKWWRAHGNRRVLTDSSPEYLQWLRNIERDSVVYGYESRVRLGNHGYHHTPEMEFGVAHEFQYYDPVVNDSTFATIVNEYELMGLTSKSLKYIRFPGFRFSRATLDVLIEHGFIFFDYWGIYDTLPWMLFISEHGRAWGNGTQWHSDGPQSYALMDSIFLRSGKLCHTHGHPSKTFDWDDDPETAYQQIHEIFQQAEDDYPNLGYMFPDEAGEFALHTYDIHNFENESFEDSLIISFSGSTVPGHTIVVEFPDSVPPSCGVTVDGQPVSKFEIRSRRLFIELPELEDGPHVVQVPFIICTSIEEQSLPSFFALSQNYPNPFNSRTSFSFFLTKRTRVNLSIYNIEGKLVKTLANETFEKGHKKIIWNGTDSHGTSVSSGIYFYRLKAENTVRTKKMVVVR